MPLLARMVAAPLSIDVRAGAVAGLGELLADRRISMGGHVAVAVGPGQGERIAELLGPTLGNADVFPVSGGTLDAALELGSHLREKSYDAVVGIGGGKTLDVTKYAAATYGIPMVSVATSLAHDGIASPVSVLDHDGGRGSYGVHIPIAVVVDLDFVRDGDARQTRSGVGDAVSNLSAIADWQLAAECRSEGMDGLAVTFARTAAEAVLHHPESLESEEFLTVLAEALVFSGLSMAVAGSSRPCSGACHEISHALDGLYPGTGTHGEQVGVGAAFAFFLRGDHATAVQLNDCLRRHGLPRGPADLGLAADDFARAVLHAPSTRPDRYTILEHLDLDAETLHRRMGDYVRAMGA